jgi:hypothetical protein
MATVTPGNHTHEQWLGLVQPVGLVVAPAVMSALQLFPNQSTPYLSARQRQLEALLEEVDGPTGQPLQVVPSFAALATELLDWGEADLVPFAQLQPRPEVGLPEVVLAEYGETLRPTHGVPPFDATGEGTTEDSSAGTKLQALVLDLSEWRDASGKPDPQWGRDFDATWNPTGNGWDATPQQRFERLLKETEIPIGLLFNGSQLRLIHAPRGESSGWITLPLEPMAEVAGRPMLGALELLLGVDRLFGGNPEQRLPALLAASRKNQNEVSTRLAEQVLEALWELLLGLDEAERIAREAGGTVLGELPKSEEGQKHLYGGLITVLLRLVFLLYAEDEALMPKDSLYGQHYSVSALADRLRQERFEHQGAMADRRGAWASLLSLFRLVYDGGGADPNYLPARHGDLFDPDTYPFLEGRDPGSHYTDDILTNVPSISDDVVEKVLTRLLWLADENKVAQRLNYRSLDVEQIGSVYEGIMGFTVETAKGPSLGITHRPPRQKITITVVVGADHLLAVNGAKREKWLDEQAGVKLGLGTSVKKGLEQASSLAELSLALGNRLSPHTPRALAAGSLILQPTAERRRSGSHYTPRSLTEPIVAEAFRPWLERCNHKPTAQQVLALKVCDPAMGSGAFLVAVCRFLASWLVKAWDNGDGHKAPKDSSLDKDLYARRLIAQGCLYGVDKNPFAVNLAKLSLWLITLSQELPFTFVDHALKCGDSLVGYSVAEIRAAMREVQLGFLDDQNQIYEKMGIDRRESFAVDSITDADYDTKRQRLEQQIKATEGLRKVGDLMVAAFFSKTKPKERVERQQVYLAMLSGAFSDEELHNSVKAIQHQLCVGEQGVKPLHWDLEFPEVFADDQRGFDVFVGNPPFIGNNGFASFYPDGILDLFRGSFSGSGGRADYVVYFLRQCFEKLKTGGVLGLIATNKISQGDTRESGLQWICLNGGTVFNATKRRPWPGVASVVVSIVHIAKGIYKGSKYLNGSAVNQISAFLLEGDVNTAPPALVANSGLTYTGVKTYSQSFLFDSCDTADIDTPGSPLPLDLARSLCDQYPTLNEVIRPYTGSEEINASPTHVPRRYAANLSSFSLEYCQDKWPDLMDLLERKVKPDRASSRNADVRAWPWWKYWRSRDEMFERLRRLDNAIVTSASAVSHHMFSMVPANLIFSQKCVVIASSSQLLLCGLQSLFHEEWSRFFGTTQGASDALTYNATDVFWNYPFPSESYIEDGTPQQKWAESFNKERSRLYRSMEIGPTKAYGRMHSPSSQDAATVAFRDIHATINDAMLHEYGWDDLSIQIGFRLENLEVDESLLDKPSPFYGRLEAQDMFFLSHGECTEFESWYKCSFDNAGPLKWRYCWSDSVRDKILARLLALTAERHQEEVAQGLHTKTGKQVAKGTGKRKKKTTPASEFGLTSESYQTGLNLF